MADNKGSTPTLGLITGGIVAFALVVFLLSGGGKKVQSDADLPPVASPKTSR